MHVEKQIKIKSIVSECIWNWKLLLASILAFAVLFGITNEVRSNQISKSAEAAISEENVTIESTTEETTVENSKGIYVRRLENQKKTSKEILKHIWECEDNTYDGRIYIESDFPAETMQNVKECVNSSAAILDCAKETYEWIDSDDIENYLIYNNLVGGVEIIAFPTDKAGCELFVGTIENELLSDEELERTCTSYIRANSSSNMIYWIKNLKAQISDLETIESQYQDYYKSENQDTDSTEISDEEKLAVIISSKLAVVYGAIIGLVLCIIFLSVRLVFGRRICLDDELNVYGIEELGILAGKLNPMQKTALKVRGIPSMFLHMDNALDSIAIQLDSLLKNKDGSSICFGMSSVSEKALLALEQLENKCNVHEILTIRSEFVCTQNEEMEARKGCNTYVLILENKTITYEDFEDMLERFSRCDIHIIGAVKVL